jgi:hypothetical protein
MLMNNIIRRMASPGNSISSHIARTVTMRRMAIMPTTTNRGCRILPLPKASYYRVPQASVQVQVSHIKT